MSYREDRYAADPTVFAASTTIRAGIIHLFDTSGGAIAQTLPQASGFKPGDGFYIQLSIAGNDLTISPFAGDTINGGGAVVLSEAETALFFIRDSLSTNWLQVLSTGGSGAPTWTPVVPGGSPYAASFDELVLLPSAPWTVTLPTIVAAGEGHSIIVKTNANDSDTVTITPAGGQTIDGAASFTYAVAFGSATLIAFGTNWSVV